MYYLYYFIRLYPILCYILTIYRMYEYFSFSKKICNLLIGAFCNAFVHIKESDEVEELYEMILATDPDKTVMIDDTEYVKYYEEEDKEVKEDWFEDQKEGQITLV